MQAAGWERQEMELAERYAREGALNQDREQTQTMNFDDIYSSAGNSLKAADLPRDVSVTIASYEAVSFKEDDGYERKKVVLSFQGKDKTLVLNKTNAGTIAEMLGKNLDTWIGQTITIGPDKTNFGGRLVDCIRVRYQRAETAPAQSQQPQQTAAAGNFDDDIPF